MQVALNLGMDSRFVLHTPLMWLSKRGAWELAEELGGAGLVDLILKESHTCYTGERGQCHEWGYGCGLCPACRLRAATTYREARQTNNNGAPHNRAGPHEGPMPRKQLGAAQGIEAAHILFQLNSKTADILRLAENAGLPSVFIHGSERVQFAPNGGPLSMPWPQPDSYSTRPTAYWWAICVRPGICCARRKRTCRTVGTSRRSHRAQADFVDGPFAFCMALLGHGEQLSCPALFCRRRTPRIRNWRKTRASRRVWPL